MRKLIGSLTGLMKRDSGPFSDARAAAQWVGELRQNDVATQLQLVREALDELAKLEVIGLPQLQALLLIDAQSQPAFDLVCQQYIQNPRMGKQIEEKLWMDIIGHGRCMLAAYSRFVRFEDPKPEEESGFLQATPLMLARGLRYVCLQVKWHFFRFEAPPPNMWAAANQLYRLSEVSQVDSDALALYPGQDKSPTSCADEYLRIQMLATLNNGNFSLRQYDWADRWLGLWTRHIQMERRYRDGVHQFCVNLADTKPAIKIHSQVDGEMIRFWGVGELLAEMNRTMTSLEAGDTPARLGLGDDARMPACMEFMKQLEILWSRERNQQLGRSERFRVNKLIDVVHGLPNIFSAIRQDDERVMARATARAAPDHDEVMDMKIYGYVTDRTKQKLASQQARSHAYVAKAKAVEHDSWMIENESEGGFGAIVPSEADWVRLGMLMAVRHDEDKHWMIAAVRRLNRKSAEQLYAGVQIISTTAVSMSMKSLDQDKAPAMLVDGVDTLGLVQPRNGLYIPYQSEQRKANTLLIHTADYQLGRLYQVAARDKVFVVRLGEILEKGPDWSWAVVEVVRREN